MSKLLEQSCNQLDSLRQTVPLVHHITNYVTVNDCANITLAVGASPIMADDDGECAQITALAQSLVLNMGTLNRRTISSMLLSGQAANEKGIPVVFDPVGAGASSLRNDTAGQILQQVHVNVLRGNLSEIRFLAGLSANTKGVDAAQEDAAEGLAPAIQMAKNLAKAKGCVVAITGATDILTDGERTLCIQNGHPMLSKVTGTGCMCSSLVGSFCGAGPDLLLGAIGGVLTMGVAGEIAYERAGSLGTGSFRVALMDAVSTMTPQTLLEHAKTYEV